MSFSAESFERKGLGDDMSARPTDISTRRGGDDAVFASLCDLSLEISAERDKTEREIKALLEQGQDHKALQLMRKHLGIVPRLKVLK
jgi:hypothetical protein